MTYRHIEQQISAVWALLDDKISALLTWPRFFGKIMAVFTKKSRAMGKTPCVNVPGIYRQRLMAISPKSFLEKPHLATRVYPMKRLVNFPLLALFWAMPLFCCAGDADQAQATSGNAAFSPPEALTAVQKQRRELIQQFTPLLRYTSPDGHRAAMNDFRQQLASLVATEQVSPLNQAQQDQKEAARQVFVQSLPQKAQVVFSAMQQRRQLLQQLAQASSGERSALIAQLRELMAQQRQMQKDLASVSASNDTPSFPSDAATTQTGVNAQAAEEHRQALQAIRQLPPNERAAALHANRLQSQMLTQSNSTPNTAVSDGTSSTTSSPQTSNP